jgi:hypothetical protein
MLFEYLNFPELPLDIEEEIFQIADYNITKSFRISDHNINADPSILDAIAMPEPDWKNELGIPMLESPFGTSKFYFCEATDNIKTWVNQNISRDINRIHIQIMFGGDFVIPHVDEIRQKAYNYILTTGGSDVETCFYEPKDEFKHLKITAQTYFPKDRLNKTYGITIFPKKWHRLSVNKIHSVENLDPTQRRISLTLSLTDD